MQNKNLTVAGNESVNQLMITMTGGENAAKDTKGSWTKVSMEEIMTWNPDIIILSNFDLLHLMIFIRISLKVKIGVT